MATQSHLKKLTFVPVSRGGGDPVANRRERFVARLAEQLELVKSPDYRRIENKLRDDGTGARHRVPVEKVVQPWFREGANGAYVLVPRIGFKTLFESERAGIAVRSRDELTDVLNALISATRAGEVDAELSRLAAPVGKKVAKGRRAA